MKPKALQNGSTIAVISPSAGLPHIFPKVHESGIKSLHSLGFKVKEYPSARKSPDFLYKNPEFRAKDINNAFKDSEVDGIWTSIGGDDSVRILPYIDIHSIKKNHKFICGFSDSTTFLAYLNQHDLVTFYGPSIMAGLAQMKNLSPDFEAHLKEFLFQNPASYEYHAYKAYSNGYKDWAKHDDQPKPAQKNAGWTWLQGEGRVSGKLFGGCIDVLEMMKGTAYWPDSDFWNDRILFLETSEDKPSPETVKCMLRNYGMQGVFSKVSALLIARPRDYTLEEKEELDQNVCAVVRDEFTSNIPIISNMDFGHTDPQFILPLGIEAELDCTKKTFKLKEHPFQE